MNPATDMIVLHTRLCREGVARHDVIDTAVTRGWLELDAVGPLAHGITGIRYSVTDLGHETADGFAKETTS